MPGCFFHTEELLGPETNSGPLVVENHSWITVFYGGSEKGWSVWDCRSSQHGWPTRSRLFNASSEEVRVVLKSRLWEVWHCLFFLGSWEEPAIAAGLGESLCRRTSVQGRTCTCRQHPGPRPRLRSRPAVWQFPPSHSRGGLSSSWMGTLPSLLQRWKFWRDRNSTRLLCSHGRWGVNPLLSCEVKWEEKTAKEKSQHTRIGLSDHQPWTRSRRRTSEDS